MKKFEPDAAVLRKASRIASSPGYRPKVLDIFAGCGGLSLGFQSAGYQIVAAIEIDGHAAMTHANNLFRDRSEKEHNLHAKPRDITKIEPKELVKEFSLGSIHEAIDVIIGGPPCQAYARVGRAKLREVADHPEAFKIDPRANLYLRYLYYVSKLKPLALLMENVPDILNHGGHNIVQEMVETLDGMGYNAKYSLLNSAHHGVPQMRDRVFMIAFRKELKAEIWFPDATNRCHLPVGYAGTRSVALKLIDMFNGSGYEPPDTGHANLPAAITALEAIGDLPPVTLHKEGKLKRGARRFNELILYKNIPFDELSHYARKMRSWPGFEGGDGVYDHVIRSLPRDTEIFEKMQQGDEYPAAHRVAEKIFEEKAKRKNLKPGTVAWNTSHRAMVPPYPVDSFPNRWWKLKENAPVRTLMAHIGKDTYSHIHFDSAQGRVISVREAARLQSFPDGFVFSGTMNPAFRQIGNAVPPLMAEEIAKSMRSSMDAALDFKSRAAK